MSALLPAARPRRLFIGLMPDSDVQRAIALQCRAWRFPPHVVLTRPQRLHLTLHFLGDVDRAREADLMQALFEVAMDEITLCLDRPELWGVAVVRPQDSEALNALHDRIAVPLRHAGLPAGAKWAPHVTIARNTRGAVPPAAVEPVRWTARDFALVWSRFEPTTRYDVLERYPIR